MDIHLEVYVEKRVCFSFSPSVLFEETKLSFSSAFNILLQILRS